MGYEKNINLRHRIFNAVFVVGICMSFSCSIMNYFLGLGWVAVLTSFACGVITIGLYIVFRIRKNYELISMIVVIMLSFVFFPNHVDCYRRNLHQHSILYNNKCRDNRLIAYWIKEKNNTFSVCFSRWGAHGF